MRDFKTKPGASGIAVILNDKPFRTPAGKDFVLPTEELAEAIAAEGRAQGEKINPASMPMMQFAATAIDKVGPDRQTVIDQLAAYVGSDLLCHRAEDPAALADRQHALWQPLLDWFHENYGIKLVSGQGLMPFPQPPDAVDKISAALQALDDFYLTGLQQASHVSGSLVLGLALMKGRLTPGAIFDAAEADALFQIEKWGEDPALAARHTSIRLEFDSCQRWFALLAKR